MSTGIARHRRGLTFDDFLAQVGEEQKAELLDGVIHVASPENVGHNFLEFWLARVVAEFVDEHDLGHVTLANIAFRLKDGRAVEPDFAFIAKRRLGILKGGYAEGAPDLAVEIVSPDSVRRDYVLKRGYYEVAGVREYWIIDPLAESGTFHGLVRGAFRDLPVVESIFHSRVLPGFSVDLRWLWRPKPPRIAKALAEIRKRARNNC